MKTVADKHLKCSTVFLRMNLVMNQEECTIPAVVFESSPLTSYSNQNCGTKTKWYFWRNFSPMKLRPSYHSSLYVTYFSIINRQHHCIHVDNLYVRKCLRAIKNRMKMKIVCKLNLFVMFQKSKSVHRI